MYTIRKMEAGDRQAVKAMMRVFYASPAVLSNGSEEIFDADIDQCLGAGHYLEGFVFQDGGEILGYAMIAKSFSTEFGKPCIWIEDLYINEGHRDAGMGTRFLNYIAGLYAENGFACHIAAGNVDVVEDLSAFLQAGIYQE